MKKKIKIKTNKQILLIKKKVFLSHISERMSVSTSDECQLFRGYRSLGLVCDGSVPAAVDKRGTATFLTVAAGKSFIVYDVCLPSEHTCFCISLSTVSFIFLFPVVLEIQHCRSWTDTWAQDSCDSSPPRSRLHRLQERCLRVDLEKAVLKSRAAFRESPRDLCFGTILDRLWREQGR